MIVGVLLNASLSLRQQIPPTRKTFRFSGVCFILDYTNTL